MKKIVTILSVLVLVFTLSACNNELEDRTEDISYWKGAYKVTNVVGTKSSYGATVEGRLTVIYEGDYGVNIDFYDKDDTLLLSGTDRIDGLSANQTAKFEVTCLDEDVAYFKVTAALGLYH